MLKLLFFDNWELDVVRGFKRTLERPVKSSGNPLFVADRPWENGNMQLYGSVAKAPGRPFQLWYSTVRRPWWIYVAYAESDDGLTWRRPLFDVFEHDGARTNIVVDANLHGAAVIRDPDDPDPARLYKMVGGAHPSKCVSVFTSADGVHWRRLRREPQIPYDPDCPMGFLRKPDGRYVAFHRTRPWWRRICRSESWDLKHWSGEPRMVLEPGPSDPPQLQFYGLGAVQYGPYEIGTLWVFHTDEDELGGGHMRGNQEAEFAYSRSGYAWHRVARGEPFILHGEEGSWESGNLQCASQPLFLDDEIRYYYAASNMRHQTDWELEPQRAGLGVASLRPDRFVALDCGRSEGELMTVPFKLPSTRVFVNARTGDSGYVKAELLDDEARPIEGYTTDDCTPVAGDSIEHAVHWPSGRAEDPSGRTVRVRLRARDAKLFSVSFVEPGEEPEYRAFRALC